MLGMGPRGGGYIPGYQLITLTNWNDAPLSGTFTVPNRTHSLRVCIVGGGGAGAYKGGGGGSGYVLNRTFSVSPGQVISYTVGAGAAATNTQINNAANGGDTTFNSVTATGGAGGHRDNPSGKNPGGTGGSGGGGGADSTGTSGTGGSGGAGGSASSAPGSDGGAGGNFEALTGFSQATLAAGTGGAGTGLDNNKTGGGGGAGGVTVNGSGPNPDSQSGNGVTGTGYGAGGGGRQTNNDASYAGHGLQGAIIIQW